MIAIEVDVSKVQKLTKRMEAGSAKAIASAVLRAAHVMASFVSKAVMEKLPGGTSQLARSFVANVGFIRSTGDVISARTFSPLPYAGIQDKGGTIRPKTARALAVPLTNEAQKRWPRDWSREQLKLVVLKGKALLVERLGKGKMARLKAHYVLKDHVTLTGREYIAAARSQGKSAVDGVIRAAMIELIRGAR